ncbi:alpha/beta fold hydrolase [Roseateles saccharophilus]|uniref:Pimeloyl-ACP methyl ester carboxylesterase n=1 Tax=Roseateles saccharophilus TaxID=304 RepID=A0A4V2VPJ0_ROSSA|nr:alpha/beta fold hydrolase [Roseateles saccharophilus]MDG0834003.1 alpha/beta fold hydrolase [Roseateles saccharophilus]TCU90939.1 pimeloyl-ACP methyl ester carboxylesterase [Roseateles saccharophilus]
MQVSANGVRIEVDIHGPDSGEPLLMIMGLGMQLIAWPEGLVDELVARGFRVIRFDNRDVGLSQPFDQLGLPNIPLAALLHTLRLPLKAPYQIADLARDAVGVLDALGLPKAHVCGASMGGMIAQHLGFAHAGRVKSLTLMMTTSGARQLPKESLKVRRALLSRPRPGSTPEQKLENVLDHYVGLYGVIGSPAYPPEPRALRERIARGVRRSFRPQAVARQLVAIAADSHRAARLPRITAPTLVIHGEADALIPVAAAHDLAQRIPGARLELIPGWGHDLPEPLWPRLADAVARNAGL